ncbi:MAG TPA: hypothetical protein VNH17_17575, partial [Streptosporangiaceae bacterium]|nr:hypothetical protein [Streptosporangiaceae bacterium]
QREALRTAFGLSVGPPPDRFLVGLAVLGLLSESAGERPVVCVVDDQQWLDRASAQALGFAARRLAADPVGLVFAARVPGEDVAGLPELVVEGLAEEDARELLESVLTGPLDARVRDRVIAETHGNPLALLELPRGLAPAQLTGGFGPSSAVSLDGRIEESFGRQLEALPAQTRRLCSWRRQIRLAIRCWCGGQPGGLRSVPGRRRRRWKRGWQSSASGCCSGIRWCARRPTGRHRPRRGRSCTVRWPRPPIRLPILIGGPGTGPRPRRGQMRKLLPNLSSAPAGPSAAVVSWRRPRSWSDPPG